DIAVRTIREAGNPKLVLLQCTTNYPSRVADANLRAIPAMRAAFEVPVGYSDHTETDACCIAAIAFGACVIEKHLTLDKTLPGPDHTSAAEPAEFAALVHKIRDTESALGTGRKEPCPVERVNSRHMRRSLAARRRISRGEVITEEMLTCKRPADGIAPALVQEVAGREAASDIEAGLALTWQMLRMPS